MKKIISVLLCICMMISVLPVCTSAENTVNDSITWNLDDNGTLKINGTGKMPDYSQSNTAPWSSEKEKIKNIEFTGEITNIGGYAFIGCANLETVKFCDSIETIGESAFESCISVEKVELPCKTDYIERNSFKNCKALKEISMPVYLCETALYNPFEGCDNLETIHVPANVESLPIGNPQLPSLFCEIDSLKRITVDESNPYYCDIDGILFSKDKTIMYCRCRPAGIKDSKYVVPSYVKEILGRDVFCGSNIKNIILSEGVEIIGDCVFMGTQAEVIVLPSTITYIGNWQYFKNIDIYCPPNAKEYPSSDKAKNVNVHLNCKTGYNALTVNVTAENGTISGAEKYTIGDIVTLSAAADTGYVFDGWYDGNTLISDKESFSFRIEDDMNLTAKFSINLAKCGDSLFWKIDDAGTLTISGTGDMYNYTDSKPAPWQSDIGKIKKLVLKEGVTSIGDYAFYPYKYSSVDITIPESLKKIGNNVFVEGNDEVNHWCYGRVGVIDYPGTAENYKNIQIGTGNTGLKYGGVYYGKVNDSVSGTYQNDDGILSEIKWTLDSSGTLIVSGTGDIPFEKEIGLYNDDGYYHKLVKKIIVEEGITGIANFGWFENLEQVSLPATLKTISNSCFNGDVKLKNIVIPDKTENIGEYAFCETAIENIKIPESVKNISAGIVNNTPLYSNESNWTDGALYINNWLIDTKNDLNGEMRVNLGTVGTAGRSIKGKITSVFLPKSIRYLSDSAFSDYNGAEIVIPSGTLEIGSSFSWTTSKSLYIPKSVAHIDSYAFAYSQLENIYYEGTEEEWNNIFAYKNEEYEKPKKATFHFESEIPVVSISVYVSRNIDEGGVVTGGGEYQKGSSVTVTAAANSGYRFTGWYVDNVAVSTESTYTFTAESDMVLTAKFERVRSSGGNGDGSSSTCTIKLDTNGGNELKNISVKRGQTIGSITEPTKEGYVFTGWYSDKELTKPYNKNENVTASTTLYAGWKIDPVRQLILTIGKKDATVFGQTKSNDVAPKIVNDRTMLPARFVAENLGAVVTWNSEKKEVTIKGKNAKNEDITILIYIDSDIAYVNNEQVKLDSPAFVENDRTYTPIRFISEQLGADVEWNENEQKVIITKSEIKK